MSVAYFQLSRTTAQPVAASISTSVAFTTALIDTGSGWDSSGKVHYTIPSGTGGAWFLWAEVDIDHGADPAQTRRLLAFVVNGVTLKAQSSVVSSTVPSGVRTSLVISTYTQLADGDTVELLVRQDSGGTATLQPPTRMSGIGAIGDGTYPEFLLKRTTGQNILTGQNTPISFDTVVKDVDSGWVTNNKTRYKVPTGRAGLYFLWGETAIDHGADPASTRRLLAFRVNGGTLVAQTSVPSLWQPTGVWTHLAIHGTVHLNDGDYVELLVRQDSGGTAIAQPATQFSGFGLIGL